MAEVVYATLQTNHGPIRLQLFPDHAPKTVQNFVGLAEGTQDYSVAQTGKKTGDRFYDGLTFHRIIPNFMIQGGCPLGTGTGGPGYTFKDEIHPELVFDKPYLLAMANAGPDTNGSQFFIVTGEAGVGLPPNYSLFGTVTDGMDVVETIEADGSTGEGPPETVHTIESVTISEE